MDAAPDRRSVWLGGLAGLALIALLGAVAPAARRAFWPPALRRFSAAAVSCVAAIALSGLFPYWNTWTAPGSWSARRTGGLDRRHAADLAAAAEEDRGSYRFTWVPTADSVEEYIDAQLARSAGGGRAVRGRAAQLVPALGAR